MDVKCSTFFTRSSLNVTELFDPKVVYVGVKQSFLLREAPTEPTLWESVYPRRADSFAALSGHTQNLNSHRHSSYISEETEQYVCYYKEQQAIIHKVNTENTQMTDFRNVNAGLSSFISQTIKSDFNVLMCTMPDNAEEICRFRWSIKWFIRHLFTLLFCGFKYSLD